MTKYGALMWTIFSSKLFYIFFLKKKKKDRLGKGLEMMHLPCSFHSAPYQWFS